MNQMNTEHTDKKYQANLQDIRQRLLRMAGMVEQMIRDSIDSLINRDMDLARTTIESDSKVNRCEIEADELCLVVLAKWQPMATDLRFITLAFKMVTDLERIGDLAVNVCERVIELGDAPPLKPYEDIPRMAQIVQEMIHDAVDAFINGDTDKAQEVIERDDEVDRLYWQVFKDLLDLMRATEDNVERGMRVQSVAKVLERMADHTTNLAEQVIFLVDGEDVRHRGKLGNQ